MAAADFPAAALDSLGLPLTAEEKNFYVHLFRLGSAGKGFITGAEAAPLLKRSKLSDAILGRIWQLADTDGQGKLALGGFVRALRLVALAQQNRPLEQVQDANRIVTILPRFEGVEPPATMASGTQPDLNASGTSDTLSLFSISPEERTRYAETFQRSSPNNGVLGAAACREIFVKSRLPDEVLGQIWTLVDVNGSGMLNLNQFSLAMFLIHKKLVGAMPNVPSTLPATIKASLVASSAAPSAMASPLPPTRESTIPSVDSRGALPRAGSIGLDAASSLARQSANMNSLSMARTMPLSMSATSAASDAGSTLRGSLSMSKGFGAPLGGVSETSAFATPDNTWSLSADDKAKFDGFFSGLDTTKKGFLTGAEAGPFFLKSGLPDAALAEIWRLADYDANGRLDNAEFNAAMLLIQRKLAGVPLPATLPLALIPTQMKSVASTAMGMPTGLPEAVPKMIPMQHTGASMASKPISLQSAAASVSPVSTAGPAYPELVSAEAAHFKVQEQLNQERAAYAEKQKAWSARQEEIQDLQQKTATIQQELLDLRAKRSALDDDLKTLDQEKSELLQKQTKLQQATEKESVLSKEIQEKYHELEASVAQLQEQCHAESTELEDLKVRVKDSQAFVQQQKDRMAEVQKTHDHLLEEKRHWTSKLEHHQMEYKELEAQLQKTNEEIAKIKEQSAKLQLQSQRQKNSVESTRKLALKAAAEHDTAQKALQVQKASIAEEPMSPISAVPAVTIRTASGNEGEMFGAAWDSRSVNSNKSEVSSAASPFSASFASSLPPISAGSNSSLNKSSAAVSPRIATIVSGQTSPIAKQLMSPLGSSTPASPTVFGDFIENTAAAPEAKSVEVPSSPQKSTVPASSSKAPSVFEEEFFSASSPVSKSTASPTKAVDDPFLEVVSNVSRSSSPSPSPSPSIQPASVASSPRKFDAKNAEKEFSNKFPTLDTFEAKFEDTPSTAVVAVATTSATPSATTKPVEDDFDAEFSTLQPAQPVASGTVDDFDIPFSEFLGKDAPASVKNDPFAAAGGSVIGDPFTSTNNPFVAKAAASGLTVQSSKTNPFDVTPITNNSFVSNFDDPFPFQPASATAVAKETAVAKPSAALFSAATAPVQSKAASLFGETFGESPPTTSPAPLPRASSAHGDFFEAAAANSGNPVTSADDFFSASASSPPAAATAATTIAPMASESFFEQAGAGASFSFPAAPKSAPPVSPTAISPETVPSPAIRELVQMGFTQEQAADALKRYDNNVQKATNFLLDGGGDESAEVDAQHQQQQSGASGTAAETNSVESSKKKGKWWKKNKKRGSSDSVKA